MDEERIYRCHQAFNIAYEEIRDNIDEPGVASKYHHAPDRLEILSSYNSHDYAEALYDQTRYLDIMQTKIMTTGERKISEINNTRIQLLGLILSITAIGVSVLSIYLGLNILHYAVFCKNMLY